MTQKNTSLKVSLAGGLALFAALIPVAVTSGGDGCGPEGLGDSTGLVSPLEGVDWTVFYTNNVFLGDGVEGDYVPTTVANKVLGEVQYSAARHGGDWSFNPPWFSGLPAGDVHIYDSSDTGTYQGGCITIDAVHARSADDSKLRWLTNHEIFHARQSSYQKTIDGQEFTGFGSWMKEGTARCLDDRYDDALDASGPFLTEVIRLMEVEHEDLGPHRDLSLLDQSYRAAMFWSYCCERFGEMQIEPDRGADFIRDIWKSAATEVENDGAKDALTTLDVVIADNGGGNLRRVWQDFTIAVLTKEFDVDALPTPERYRFIDDTAEGNPGGDPYPAIERSWIFDGSLGFPQTLATQVQPFGHRYYELTNLPVPSVECNAIGLKGSSDLEIGWALIGFEAGLAPGDPERAVLLSRQQTDDYVQVFFNSFDHPLTRLGVVISGLEQGGSFKFALDVGQPVPTIVRPDAEHPVYPGPHDDPGRVLVRAMVLGPDGLKPDGIGPRSIKGLDHTNFVVRFGSKEGEVLSAAYTGGEYWLVVQAPEQRTDGIYNLAVEICSDSTFPLSSTEVDAVVYGDISFNHVLVADRSGSMQFPDDGSGSKLDALKTALSLYVDAVNEDDRLAVVAFSGNNSECNEDAFTNPAIGIADTAQRDAARNAIAGLNPAGWTSAGDGLWNAQDELESIPGNDARIDTVVLVSDGRANENRFWETAISCPGDLGDSVQGRVMPTATKVNAIALGPEANQSLMQTIGEDTDGDFTYIDVSDNGAGFLGSGQFDVLVNDLGDGYMTLLERARRLERMFFRRDEAEAGEANQFLIPIHETGLQDSTFFFHWPDGAGAVTIRLRDPDGNLIGPADAEIQATSTHVVYHLNSEPMTGAWSARLLSPQGTEFIAGLMARQTDGVQMLTDVSEIRTGGAFDLPDALGSFECGVPVQLISILTDENGPVLGADVTATVLLPDGTLSCPLLHLRDDGTGGDERADDGVYVATFSDTSQAGTIGGTVNDDPGNPNPGGQRGAYRVDIEAQGAAPAGGSFQRFSRESFHIFKTQTTLDDSDFDGLPDPWEEFYGTDLTVDDSLDDPDGDGLVNIGELQNGCDPFDQDTDGGGESDRSEVLSGRCPLDPDDDLLPCPVDVGVVTDTEHDDDTRLVPLANLLRFPVHSSYEELHVYRSLNDDPDTFVLVHALARPDFELGNYYDMGLLDGQTYYYRLQAIGANGARSCLSRIFSGEANAQPVPPYGWIQINSGSARTGSTNVLVTLDLSNGANRYRISNQPLGGSGVPLIPMPASPYVNWTLSPPFGGGTARVYVQYYEPSSGKLSPEICETILFDPNGDPDLDGLPNSIDLDDEGDGVPDIEEVFIHHTDAFQRDTDDDFMTDGEEIASGCMNPRNPDSDGDGILDGAEVFCGHHHK